MRFLQRDKFDQAMAQGSDEDMQKTYEAMEASMAEFRRQYANAVAK